MAAARGALEQGKVRSSVDLEVAVQNAFAIMANFDERPPSINIRPGNFMFSSETKTDYGVLISQKFRISFMSSSEVPLGSWHTD